MVYFSKKQTDENSNKIEQLEKDYKSLLEQLKKSNVVVDLLLSTGKQTTGTLGTATIYMTEINTTQLMGNDIKNLVNVMVYHPNGTLQANRMMTFGYMVQYYSQDTTKEGILVTGIPTGAYNDNYYKSLKVKLFFNNANYGA